MSRLTSDAWRNFDRWECCGQDSYCKRGSREEGGCYNGCIVPELYFKLAELEDAESEGKLIELPCKVGDTVYVLDEAFLGDEERYKISTIKVSEITFNHMGAWIMGEHGEGEYEWGKYAFLAKSDAEKALEVSE